MRESVLGIVEEKYNNANSPGITLLIGLLSGHITLQTEILYIENQKECLLEKDDGVQVHCYGKKEAKIQSKKCKLDCPFGAVRKPTMLRCNIYKRN